MPHGITVVEFSGREISELRHLVWCKIKSMKNPKTMMEKQTKTILTNMLRKLWGEYRCKHCQSWVSKYKEMSNRKGGKANEK